MTHWTCAVCAKPRNDRPAHEHQHLFPGCGYVCGYFTRICVACWPETSKLTRDEIVELYKKDHDRHHAKSPPEKPPLVTIGGVLAKKEAS